MVSREELQDLFSGLEPEAQDFLMGRNLMKDWGLSDGIDNGGKWDGVGRYRNGHPGPYLDYLEKKGLAQTHIKDYRGRGFTGCKATPLKQEDYCDDWIARQAVKLLKESPEGKPWFIQINFNGAHNPWDVTEQMKKDMEKRDPQYPKPFKSIFPFKKKLNEIRQNYSAQVENIDSLVGDLMAYLEETGQLENTIIAYTGDHGEMLGDHNHRYKRYPFHPSVCVPMIINGPGIKKRGRIKNPTETIDLSGTFLDYAGVSIPSEMDCKSLRPYLEGISDKLPRDVARSGFHGWRMAFDGKYKLVCGFEEGWKDIVFENTYGGTKRKVVRKDPICLYDLENDPDESENVAEDHPEVVERLMEFMEIPPQEKNLRASSQEGVVYGSCAKCPSKTRLYMDEGYFVCKNCRSGKT